MYGFLAESLVFKIERFKENISAKSIDFVAVRLSIFL